MASVPRPPPDFRALDDVARQIPPASRARGLSVRTWLGLATFGALTGLFLLPIERFTRAPTVQRVVPTIHEGHAGRADGRRTAIESVSIAASLASAATALARIEVLRRETRQGEPVGTITAPRGPFPGDAPPMHEPPQASSYASPTACLATYLSEIELEGRELDLVCRISDLWAVERKLHERFASRPGIGAQRWRALGQHTLAAIAVGRAGCCPDAPPLEALVPGLFCGVLRDTLRAMGPVPDRISFSEFERTMTCLTEKGVHLPPRWGHYSAEQRGEAFRHFVTVARTRGAEVPPELR